VERGGLHSTLHGKKLRTDVPVCGGMQWAVRALWRVIPSIAFLFVSWFPTAAEGGSQTMYSTQHSRGNGGAFSRPVANGGELPKSSEPTSKPPEPGRVAVTEYLVEGNTILSQEKINEILSRYKGSSLTLKEIEKARLELEKAYHAAGYPTVIVVLPEQTIDQGTVRLTVIEARLVEILVTGNRYFSRYNILRKLPSLKIGALLYEPTFVKELDAANANPDLKLAPVLKPGEVPGTVNLELKAKERLPLHARVEGDNRGPITTPRDRITAEVQYANLWDLDHILTVQTVQTPTDLGAVQVYGGSYVAPIIWPNHLLAVYGTKAISNSVLAGSSLAVGAGSIAIAGNATIAGARYIFPIFSGWTGTHQIAIGADYKRLEKTTAEFPQGLGTVTVTSPIQYLPMSIGYTGYFPDSWGLTKLTSTVKGYNAGLIPGGDTEDFGGNPNDPNQPGNRVGSTGDFVVVQGGVDRTQPLPYDFSLFLHADGQWANEPLIPAEQYFAGGLDTVRGYIQYETAGDNAVRGRAELTSPELPPIPIDRFWQRRKSSEYNLRFRFVAFFDAAYLWVLNAQPGQRDHFNPEGVGFGLRMKMPKDVGQLILDQAWALQDGTETKKGDTFVHFAVSVAF